MGLVTAIRDRSARAARRALILISGVAFLLIGIGFLTSAAWIMLEEVYSAAAASAILSGVYAGVGLVAIAIASSSAKRELRTPERPVQQDPAETLQPGVTPPLVQAFLIGLNAALAARGRGPTSL
ncbi:MAG: phage holin family protein [Rhodobacterales bacterium]|nr:phage holin family protein [Rhodobacterales bacterium]